MESAHKFSREFEDAVAHYATGDRTDRSENTILELYIKHEHVRMFFEFCRRYIDISGTHFLEVGCGTGYASAAAIEMGADVTATDFVDTALFLTRKRLAELGLRAKIKKWDVRKRASNLSERFDFVWCFQILEHVPRLEQFQALSNILDCVKVGGYIFIDTENRLCPFDRHDTRTWLLRYLSKSVYDPIFKQLGWGVNFLEPSTGEYVQTRDYMSYDELVGACAMRGFRVVDPYMPHGSKQQYLYSLTGSAWLYDNIGKYIDLESLSPISILLQRVKPKRRRASHLKAKRAHDDQAA